jgi:hypothetical protein
MPASRQHASLKRLIAAIDLGGKGHTQPFEFCVVNVPK